MTAQAKLFFLSLFFFFPNLLYGGKEQVFENFKGTNIFISQNDIKYLKNGNNLSEPYYFSDGKIHDILIAKKDSIPPSITEILYSHILKDFHNALTNKYDFWEIQNWVNMKRQGIALAYIGIIPISSEYESYLFMADINSSSKNDYINIKFYLLNIQKERLMSIFNISSLSSNWSESSLDYTIVASSNILTRKNKSETFDIVYVNEGDERKAKEEQKRYEELKTRNYKIDHEGYIKIIDL